jgi:phosphoglycerol geranylgeranyltransferase
MSAFDLEKFVNDLREKKRGLFVLLDPDSETPSELARKAVFAEKSGADAFLIGGSFFLRQNFECAISEIKSATELPLIIFPGNGYQISAEADGLLFLSLISGRNARWLIEEQVHAAPRIREAGISTLSTGYMLVESGNITSVAFISDTTPIPREKPDIAVAHALAAELLGMKSLYLEAGSGAKYTVPPKIVSAVRKNCGLPLFVGGGIRDVETAAEIVKSGADFLVVGTAFEKNPDPEFLREISSLFG